MSWGKEIQLTSPPPDRGHLARWNSPRDAPFFLREPVLAFSLPSSQWWGGYTILQLHPSTRLVTDICSPFPYFPPKPGAKQWPKISLNHFAGSKVLLRAGHRLPHTISRVSKLPRHTLEEAKGTTAINNTMASAIKQQSDTSCPHFHPQALHYYLPTPLDRFKNIKWPQNWKKPCHLW